MHSLTEMVRQLRKGNGKNGLVLANGGVATYQHVVCLSTRPKADGSAYPQENPLPDYVDDLPVPKVTTQAEGEAVIEVSQDARWCLAAANGCIADIYCRIQQRRHSPARSCSGTTEGEWTSFLVKSCRCEHT